MSSDKKEAVLITGANGFVGSRLCRLFINEGFHVVAGVRQGCNRTLIENLPLEYRFGDVSQPETLPALVEGIDFIIHNAGLTKVKKKADFHKVNEIGAKNLIEAAPGNPALKKYIYISSAAASGPSQPSRPLTEIDLPHPITEYGRSKLAGEQASLLLKDKVNLAIIRPPAVYGPGDKEMLAFFQIINCRLRPLLGNTGRKIQLVHVDDLCRGVLAAIRATTISGAVYFIAESRSYTYRELVGLLGQAVGKTGLPLYIPGPVLKVIAALSESTLNLLGKSPMFTREKAGEILAGWEFSTAGAEKDLGFISKIDFKAGSAETMQWYRREGWL